MNNDSQYLGVADAITESAEICRDIARTPLNRLRKAIEYLVFPPQEKCILSAEELKELRNYARS